MRLAFVSPRYGADILGGAEAMARELAEELRRRGWQVDALTTCARDHLTWRNEMPAGLDEVNGVPVRRFPVRDGWDTPAYRRLTERLLTGQPVTRDEEYAWAAGGAHSPHLYAYLQRCRADYDLVFFIPYLAPTTALGAHVTPERSIVWPCLHDELLARLHPVRLLMSGARGLMFNSEPERRLAHRLGVQHPREAVVGFGLRPQAADAERFRQATGLSDPFILYSGRLEPPKNVPLLIHFFVEYKRLRGGPLKLALMGAGPVRPPEHPDIVSLGFRQGQAKHDAYAAAWLLCQPSVNESFSLVIMEAWLAQAPVLVHSDCAVTRHHAERSHGGLHFQSFEEFAGVLDMLQARPDVQRQLGRNGQRYVASEFSWEAVVARFEQAVGRWQTA